MGGAGRERGGAYHWLSGVLVRPQVGVTDVRGPNLWVGVADIGSQSPTWSDRAHPRASWFHLRRALAAEPLAESRGRKERDAAPLAPTAAMKAVVQRVTRASVTGQSGGAGAGPGRSHP